MSASHVTLAPSYNTRTVRQALLSPREERMVAACIAYARQVCGHRATPISARGEHIILSWVVHMRAHDTHFPPLRYSLPSPIQPPPPRYSLRHHVCASGSSSVLSPQAELTVSRCSQRYFATAIGKAKQAAKTELEKLNLKELSAKVPTYLPASPLWLVPYSHDVGSLRRMHSSKLRKCKK